MQLSLVSLGTFPGVGVEVGANLSAGERAEQPVLVRASETPCLSNGNRLRFKGRQMGRLACGSRDGLHP
jgi:hypothetical protein